MTQDRPYQPDSVRQPPPQLITPEVVLFSSRVDAICDREDMLITSFWRSVEDNARVGGAAGSLHLEGLAADADKFGADIDVYERIAADFNAIGIAVLIYYDGTRSYMHTQARPLLSGAMLGIVT